MKKNFEVSLFLNMETIDLESLASQQVIEIGNKDGRNKLKANLQKKNK